MARVGPAGLDFYTSMRGEIARSRALPLAHAPEGGGKGRRNCTAGFLTGATKSTEGLIYGGTATSRIIQILQFAQVRAVIRLIRSFRVIVALTVELQLHGFYGFHGSLSVAYQGPFALPGHYEMHWGQAWRD